MMDEQKEMNHMRELVELLNRARRSYEQENTEIMSNYEYDKLYDELQELEEKLGTRMANSPTVNVGYEVLSELPKERHERPMLSLDKTKDETGWTYCCSDLSERRNCEGSHQRKRSDR